MTYNLLASLYILIAIFIWSSLGVIVRKTDAKIHELIFFSNLISIIVQLIIIFFRGYYRNIPSLRNITLIFVLGCVSLINTFSYFFAFNNTTIANSVLTHYTAPIFVAIISPFVLKERLSWKIFFSIVVASIGLLIMLNGFSAEKRHLPGIISGLISGIAYAILIILIRMFTKKINPLFLAFLVNTTIVIILSPFISRFPSQALLSFIIIGIMHSTIAPVIYYAGMKYITANKTAVLGYLEPVCAIILSYIFLNEKPYINTILGGSLIIISGYITLKHD